MFNCISALVPIHAWIGMCSHAECVCYGISSRTGYGCKYLIRHSFFRSFFSLFFVPSSGTMAYKIYVRMRALTHTHTYRNSELHTKCMRRSMAAIFILTWYLYELFGLMAAYTHTYMRTYTYTQTHCIWYEYKKRDTNAAATSRFHVRILFYRTWNGKHEHSAVLNWIEMIVYFFFINPQFVWKKKTVRRKLKNENSNQHWNLFSVFNFLWIFASIFFKLKMKLQM